MVIVSNLENVCCSVSSDATILFRLDEFCITNPKVRACTHICYCRCLTVVISHPWQSFGLFFVSSTYALERASIPKVRKYSSFWEWHTSDPYHTSYWYFIWYGAHLLHVWKLISKLYFSSVYKQTDCSVREAGAYSCIYTTAASQQLLVRNKLSAIRWHLRILW